MLGETTEFGGKVPVAAMVGDQQGALYGQACLEPGLSKNTYGTGNFLLHERRRRRRRSSSTGLITTIAWGIGDRVDYAMESSMFVTGAGVQWLRDGLKIIEQRGRDRGARRARWTPTRASTSSPR